MQIKPILIFDTKEIKHIVQSAITMATADKGITDVEIESIIPLALGNGEWSLSIQYNVIRDNDTTKN